MFETWAEMNDRHALEKAEAVASLRDAGLTQTQAANKLGIPLGHLNSFIKRNSIPWTEAMLGVRESSVEKEIDEFVALIARHEFGFPSCLLPSPDTRQDYVRRTARERGLVEHRRNIGEPDRWHYIGPK